MASMQYPPGNSNLTVNYVDTIILEYSSTYPQIDLILYCETAPHVDRWWMWDLPGPLVSKGTFNLHLADYNLTQYLNSFPTDCHFDIINASDSKTKVNAGLFSVSTANKAVTTYARTATATFLAGATSIATISPSGKPTASASSSSQTSGSNPAGASSTGTASATDPDPTGLSAAAKVGLGVGIGLGGALLIVLGLLAIMMYRKRKMKRTPTMQATAENTQHEKAELLGTTVTSTRHHSQFSELAVPTAMKSSQYLDAATNPQQPQWGPPQELPGNTSYENGIHEPRPGQRFELGP